MRDERTGQCRGKKPGLLVCLLPLMLAACSMMPCVMDQAIPPAPAASDTFKVLTYNALHGLEVHRFWVRVGESPEQRAARFAFRIDQLAEVQPDLIFLQEVNPLPEMAQDYVAALERRGVHYSQVHQVDACGLRVAPGLALLPGLNNGLVILAKAPFQVRKIEGLKLSGGIGGCHDRWGLQFGEPRYALIAEVSKPGGAMRYLVATAHLHSGIERDARVLHELMQAQQQGRLHHYDEVKADLVQDEKRRLMELHTLMLDLQKLQGSGRYAGVIIGGDFNFEAGEPEYKELERAGF
jgi:endonuclease/exonuclease/phosphatase family metal-dependent hydrolase